MTGLSKGIIPYYLMVPKRCYLYLGKWRENKSLQLLRGYTHKLQMDISQEYLDDGRARRKVA